MATTATLTYTASPVVIPLAQLVAAMAAVALPTSDLVPLGVAAPTSDVTAAVAGKAQRTITFSLLPIFTSFLPVVPPFVGLNFQGSVVSSSPQDSPSGVGARQVRMRGLNVQGKPYVVEAALQGTTPVPWIPQGDNLPVGFGLTPTPYGIQTFRSVTSLEVVQTGSSGAQAGMISVYSSLNAQGDLITQTFPNANAAWQGSIVSTSDADAAGGAGAHTVTITYVDNLGAPQAPEVVTLNGTTPVTLSNTNHGQILSMTVTAAGALTANVGQVTLFQGLNATAGIAGQLQPSFSGLFPTPGLRFGPFEGLYTQILAAKLQSTITELPVAIA